MRRINPDGPDADLAMELSSGQTKNRLNRMVRQDKERAVVKYRQEIARAESRLSRTQNKTQNKGLKQKIKSLEGEIKKEQRFL